jgi:hypothetical protein
VAHSALRLVNCPAVFSEAHGAGQQYRRNQHELGTKSLIHGELLELLAGRAHTGAFAASLRLMVHVSVLCFRPFPGPHGTVIALPAYLYAKYRLEKNLLAHLKNQRPLPISKSMW